MPVHAQGGLTVTVRLFTARQNVGKKEKYPLPHGSGCFVFYEIVAFLSAFGKFFLLEALRNGDGDRDGGADHGVVAH